MPRAPINNVVQTPRGRRAATAKVEGPPAGKKSRGDRERSRSTGSMASALEDAAA